MVINAFILSFLAGISTIFGSLIIFICKKDDRVVTKTLSFASGVMICVCIYDLIPSSYNLILTNNLFFLKLILTLIFIVIGINISIIIDKYVPNNYDNSNNDLYKIGIISMIAIIIHNIPEGIATFITSTNDIKLGLSLTLAIAMHNIPEGISVSIPIYKSTNNKRKALLCSLLSGLSEVFGSILALLFLRNIINNNIMAILYAIIAGIMIHISIYELLREAYKKGSNKEVINYFIFGFIIMLLSHLIIR